MTIRLAALALPFFILAGCASAPEETQQRTTSSLERPEDCPTGTRVCRRGTGAGSTGTATISGDDLRRSRVGTTGANTPIR